MISKPAMRSTWVDREGRVCTVSRYLSGICGGSLIEYTDNLLGHKYCRELSSWEVYMLPVDNEHDTTQLLAEDQLKLIKERWAAASPDIESLFEQQPVNSEDGSQLIDGQACHELMIAICKGE